MKIEGNNTSPLRLFQQMRSVEKEALKNIEQDEDSVSISKNAKILAKLNNCPDVRIERIRIAKQLIEEEQEISRKRVQIGIKKMLLGLFSQQSL